MAFGGQEYSLVGINVVREHEVIAVRGRKACFVPIAGVGALLDLDHLKIVENFKAVTAGSQQDNVAGIQNAALQIGFVAIVEIDAQPAALYNQNLLGVSDVSRHDIVHVWLNELALGMAHVGELLREFVRREEMHAVAGKIVANNDGEEIFLVFDVFEHKRWQRYRAVHYSSHAAFLQIRARMNRHSVSCQVRMARFPRQPKYP
jgi:hypothetical protein